MADSPQVSRRGAFTAVIGGTGALELSQVEIEFYKRLQAALTINSSGALTLLQALTLNSVLGVGSGGTGLSAYTIGDLIYASAADTLAALADVATGNVLISGGVGAAPAYGKVTNSHIDAAAAIAYSKLNLATSIVNADIATSAAIAYSKLNLATSIVDADVNASAAIAYSKLNLATSIVNADIGTSAAIALSKLAQVTASRLLGAGSAGASTPAEITVSTGLTLSGTTLTATGRIVQIVHATHATEVSSTSSTYADTGLTASITPSSASNKVLAFFSIMGCQNGNGTLTVLQLKALRDATLLGVFSTSTGTTSVEAGVVVYPSAVYYHLDSPASTSALTYKVQFASSDNTTGVRAQANNAISSLVLMEVTP